MAQALSVDLRTRVVAAIEGGLSRRQAAERFGVSASSAVRWDTQHRTTGDVTPQAQGGDRKSKRIEACSGLILGAVEETPDITLKELQARLRDGHGTSFGMGTLWRFFKRRKITLKKRQPMQANRNGPM